MSLPELDVSFLRERGLVHDIIVEGGTTCVVLPQWPLPCGFNRPKADLLVRLRPGYPDVPPDMWWFSPPVHRADGLQLPATNVYEEYLGRRWQRWSRHFNGNQWKTGIDCLESYLALIRHSLQRSVPESAQ